MRRALIALSLVPGVALAQPAFPPTPPADYTDAQAAAASPVKSVNALTGAVTVPSSIRASCTISTFDGTGAGSCALANFSGGTAFTTMPDCYASISAGSTTYVYADPIVTPGMTTVSVTEQAALKVLTISLGLATIWGAPPAGTTITMFCRGS